MADEIPVAQPAPVAAPAVEVALIAPVTAPEPVAPSPVVVVEPVTPAAPAPAVEPAKPTTVLGEPPAPIAEAKPVEPPKPAEGAKPDGEPKAPEVQSAEPALPPSYDAFVFPEGATFDETRVKEFTSLLGEMELASKADHAAVQAFGQKAVDFHVAEINKALETQQQHFQTIWDDQKIAWKDQFISDPEIGGNRMQSTVDAANTFIRTHGGTAEQQAEFRGLMESSGLGNHPAMIRILAKAGMAMSEGSPLAAQVPPATPKSGIEKFYGPRRA